MTRAQPVYRIHTGGRVVTTTSAAEAGRSKEQGARVTATIEVR